MSVIDSIRLSGVTYTIQGSGGGGNPTVELTQAEYDALVTAGTVSPNTYYIITDAQAGDLTNYYTKTETNTLLGGKADTATTYTKTEVDNAITAATATKQDTLVSGTNIKTINNESLLGSGNITIQGGGGGGKAISAGTNISITTGETADTINCTLPITASTSARRNDLFIGNDIPLNASNYGRIIIGNGNKMQYNNTRTDSSILIATPNSNSSIYNIVKANSCIGIGGDNLEVGYDNINGYGSIAIGFGAKSNINKSLAIGYNTVASGTTQTNINNQLTIDTSNQVYIYNKDNTEMICLQDNLGGGGGGGVTTGEVQTMIDESVSGKQDTLVSGTNIKTINNQSILGSGNIDIQGGGGGSITIDPSLDSGSTNAVANSAITTAINSKVTNIIRGVANWVGNGVTTLNVNYTGTSEITRTFCASINNKQILTGGDYSKVNKFSLVETSAITTSITSSSTDAQVPSAKAVNDKLGGLSVVKLTESEYTALVTKDSNTLYVVVPDPSN